MITILLFLFAAAIGYLGRTVYRLKREIAAARKAADDANERLHAVANSAMRGHPSVKWRHPSPTPASDAWYWLSFESGAPLLHTDEARREALRRAALLYPGHRKS